MALGQGTVADVVMDRAVDFWRGKRVLVTGHTGFKGAWLVMWLKQLGALVTGIALPPATRPSLFELARVNEGIDHHFGDIRDAPSLARIVRASRPQVVFHLAAQALVRLSYREPLQTLSSNVMGTAHMLDALRDLDGVRVAVMVTTDKVYHNREWPYPYREDDALGGHDPYSASKAASEIVIASYRDAYLAEQGVAVASARAGNVIGGGDWSDDRLLPDALRAWQSGRVLEIRRPEAIRPWQHVLEPLSGYLALARQLWTRPELAGAYNFGPLPDQAATVRKVIELARSAYGTCQVSYQNDSIGPHEAGCLTLEVAKVRVALGVTPRLGLAQAVHDTVQWYRAQHQGADVRALCEAQIAAFEALP